MESDSNILRNTIIGTVAGGIILSIIQWATGYVTKVIFWFWQQLNAKVAVDIWVLVLLSVFLLAYVVITIKRISKLTSKVTGYERLSAEARRAGNIVNLNERELEALKQHAELLSNYGITASSLAKDISVHKQEAQYILDSLSEKHLIEFAFDADNGEDAYQLTKAGRKFLVEKNYLASNAK